MNTIKNNTALFINQKQLKFIKYHKTIVVFSFLFLLSHTTNAQKGLFVKFSLGSGYVSEFSNINSSGFGIAMKNHAIGWGLTDNFALHVGEFGGLVKQKVDDYNYINLDAFGLGFSYKAPFNIRFSFLGAYSTVKFAKEWSESGGDDGGNGFGMNMSVDKEWFIAKRWGARVGPHLFWLKTNNTNYSFFNISLNGSIVFYLTPVK